jgi:hypothetical protein
LCAPDVGEDGWQAITWDKLPATWPDHFDKAIRILNWRILPALKFCPKEILLGLVVNTSKTPIEVSSSFLPPSDIDTHMTYTAQQRLDGYAEAVHHAVRRKAAFDRRVTKSRAGVVEFKKGELVQVYKNKLALTLSTERKLTPMWSPPCRVAEHLLNSYRLETLDRTPMEGLFNARHLRIFIPREGTELAVQQKEFEERLASQGVESGELGEPQVEALAAVEGGGVVGEGLEDPELEFEDSELGVPDEDSVDDAGFFYEDEEEEQEGDDIGIGARVAARRRGRLLDGGGQME